ncbi:MAG TPA: thioredoxin domain-containing protein [Candidatus Bilamarchaeaceae archaeon]|nr:thioredoxin domain-containing protein [Candidatus Bilamarchaeaceae archaeon]
MKKRIFVLILLILFLAGCTQISSADTEANNIINNNTGEKDAMAEKSDYLSFSKEKYDKSKQEGKTIFLEFAADWCPSCQSQHPKNVEAFEQLKDKEIIGFRVNFKDSNTDEDEVNLAKEFGITYQHTRVILNSEGEVVQKATGEWSSGKIIEELKKVE